MSLPSPDELIAELRAQQGSHMLEEECPICGGPSEVITSCRHAFCLRCLEVWLIDRTDCPLCRTELCEKVEASDEGDGDGPEATEARSADPLFERLDLDFDIDNGVVANIILHQILPAGYQNTKVDDKAVVRVNYDSLMPWAVAYMTINKRDVQESHSSLEEVARDTWNVVAGAVHSVIRTVDGTELEGGELWDMLDRKIHQETQQRGMAELKYAEGLGGTSGFRYDLLDSLDKIVYEARRYYLEHLTVAPEEYAIQSPIHVIPMTFEFEIDEASVIRAVEALDGHGSGKLDLRGMDSPDLYINCRRLIPFMVAAVFVHKPLCQPPEGADARRYEIAMRHAGWELAAWELSDCLEDLHGQTLSANELEQTLTWSLGDLPSADYGSSQRGPLSFAEDLAAMLHTFIFWVFKVNNLQPPGPMKLDKSNFTEASSSDGWNNDDTGDRPYTAWSGADSRSRSYLQELW